MHLNGDDSYLYYFNSGIYLAWSEKNNLYDIRLVGLGSTGYLKPMQKDKNTIEGLSSLKKFLEVDT